MQGCTVDFALDETKVGVNVKVACLSDDLGMTFQIHACNGFFLSWFHVMVEPYGVGASSAKGVSWVKGLAEFQGGDVDFDVWTGLFLS